MFFLSGENADPEGGAHNMPQKQEDFCLRRELPFRLELTIRSHTTYMRDTIQHVSISSLLVLPHIAILLRVISLLMLLL